MTLFSKSLKSAAIVAILTANLAVVTVQAQPARPQSYPMTCRGGGTLTIRNDGGNGVQIKFQPASGAAPQGLSPGQCTWSDRALRPGEPTTICDSSESASQYVDLLVQSNQYAIMQVYNDGQGCMRVTRLGP
jgi:hypothetical protein